MKQKRWVRILSILTVLILTMMTAAAEPKAEEATSGEAKGNIRLSITREYSLIKEAGMNLAAWDEALAERKQAGLSDAISKEAILKADPDAQILEEDGLVYQIGPSGLFGTVTDALDAYQLAYRLIDLLGGSSLTELYLFSRLTMNDTTVYSLQQVSDAREVLGGVLKIALNGNNEVTAVFSSIDPKEDHEQKQVTRQEAEEIAAARCAEDGRDAGILNEYTQRLFRLPCDFALALNMDVELGPIPQQLVWVVYTPNQETEAADQAEGKPDEDRPYLAHYVLADGTYLFSLPVREPGDDEARAGYRKEDLFAGLETDTYTGEITDINGNVRTVTVPVMRSEADNCWYLGDVGRRIAFADYFEAAYGENHDLVLIKSENNTDWDSEDIYLFHNYLCAWDFYADMGWIGPDGEGTDEIILKGMCYSNGMVYSNACSVGKLETWQVFAYAAYEGNGEPTRLGWGMDIMAHEYTHTFTAAVMNTNLYENDYGAINEAMSDILGNLVEYINQDTEDQDWIIGENSGYPLRDMVDPEAFGQPASVWGLYYVPGTDTPNTVNDRGGVHYNSSLLNLIGSKLCTEYGMSYEEATSFWVMTALGLTPKTDYLGIRSLLSWAMKETGLSDAYGDALALLTGKTRIGETEMPETLPEGQKMIRLTLPDTEAFRNKEWCLYITQMDLKTREEMVDDLLEIVTKLLKDEEYRQAFRDSAKQLLDNLELQSNEIGFPKLVLRNEEGEEENDVLGKLLGDLMNRASGEVIKGETALFSWEEENTGVIPAVIMDKPTLYILMNISNGGSQIEKLVYLLGDSWFDLTDFVMEDAYNPDETMKEKLVKLSKDLGKQALANTLSAIRNITKEKPKEDGSIPIEYLPTSGLENVRLETAEE